MVMYRRTKPVELGWLTASSGGYDDHLFFDIYIQYAPTPAKPLLHANPRR
jgi:hypothetical protein